MNIRKLRRVLGDTSEPYQWSDADLEDWVAFADGDDNEYLVAADILGALCNQLVASGSGTSIRSDDVTINDYNNVVLLRERIKDLRTQGNDLNRAGGMVVAYPYDIRY